VSRLVGDSGRPSASGCMLCLAPPCRGTACEKDNSAIPSEVCNSNRSLVSTAEYYQRVLHKHNVCADVSHRIRSRTVVRSSCHVAGRWQFVQIQLAHDTACNENMGGAVSMIFRAREASHHHHEKWRKQHDCRASTPRQGAIWPDESPSLWQPTLGTSAIACRSRSSGDGSLILANGQKASLLDRDTR
jgi:hypothetical protein